jgi:hypothetical protein
MEHQTELKFIIEAGMMQDAVSFVDASFLEVIERLARPDITPVLMQIINQLDRLNDRLTTLENDEALTELKVGYAGLRGTSQPFGVK